MNWKQSLDRYLTTPPDDGFTYYCEAVIEAFTDTFFDANESWILDEAEQLEKWLDKLFFSDVEPVKAAKIVERAFKFYYL